MWTLTVGTGARRRMRIGASLPADHPGLRGAITDPVSSLPDPVTPSAAERAGSMDQVAQVRNLVLLCQRCHRDLHHGHYTITMTSHGTPHITPSRAPPHRSR